MWYVSLLHRAGDEQITPGFVRRHRRRRYGTSRDLVMIRSIRFCDSRGSEIVVCPSARTHVRTYVSKSRQPYFFFLRRLPPANSSPPLPRPTPYPLNHPARAISSPRPSHDCRRALRPASSVANLRHSSNFHRPPSLRCASVAPARPGAYGAPGSSRRLSA